jgi:hypothetical protein
MSTQITTVPTYNGYSMSSNLNGTTIGVGTSYLGIGLSTPNVTEAKASVVIAASQGSILGGYVKTGGIMTGSMQLTIMIEGVAVGTPYTIPAGSAGGTYTFLSSAGISNGSNVSIRVIQSTATSPGMFAYGWVIK